MYLELQEDQQEHHPFPAASASKPELAEYKRKVMGQMKRQDELQIKREEKNEQENERRKRLIEEHQERQKQERIIEKANDKLKRQLGMFAPWINTQYEQQYKKRVTLEKGDEGLMLPKTRIPRRIFMQMQTLTKRQMKLFDKDDAKKVTALWDRHVRQKMGRVRKPVGSLFDAASLAWFGTMSQSHYVFGEV